MLLQYVWFHKGTVIEILSDLLNKGTVNINLSEFPLIEWHVRFTTVPLKSLFVKV